MPFMIHLNQTNSRNPARLTPARPGIALLMVMGAVAIVFVIGMSLLSGLPASALISANSANRNHAAYLADSALTEALYRLKNPEDAEVWAGVTNRQVPGLNGSYDLIVTELADDQYELTAIGRANGRAGRIITHQLRMIVQVRSEQVGDFVMHAPMLFGTNITIPSSMTVEGDIFANGSVTNYGHIDGTIFASLGINDLGKSNGTQADTTVSEFPVIDPLSYETYTYNGQTYQASVLTASDVSKLPKVHKPITASNPLGIIIVKGNLRLKKDLEIDNGILMVTGSLTVSRVGLKVTSPLENQVALVAKNLRLAGTGPNVVVENGPAHISQNISHGKKARSISLDFESGLMLGNAFSSNFSGTVNVRYPALESTGSVGISIGGDQGGAGQDAPKALVDVLSYQASPSDS